MARGPKKHLKRLVAPKSWMLDKLGGCFAPKPASGPHKQRECIPLILLLRNRLKYALTLKEVVAILMQRLIKVDLKVRTERCYPLGLMGKTFAGNGAAAAWFRVVCVNLTGCSGSARLRQTC